ncbi:Wings apart-like protein [Penicillium malachiteum]|uniref:Wings apart-like protein n=1 Tax=Penicillium malachiteum TaxID=1324776 RepID=A0AAD6MWY1_9EURO|nr:Wings apart-like protein [Penicillium malachiteum]
MQSRPKGRRLITYGSTARNQPHSKAANARVAPAVRSIQSRSCQSAEAERPGKKHLQGNDASGADIYDLPSSDDEAKPFIPRTKRRRYASKEQKTTSHQDQVEVTKNTIDNPDPKPSTISAPKRTTASPELKTITPPTRRSKRNLESSGTKQQADLISESPRVRRKTDVALPEENGVSSQVDTGHHASQSMSSSVKSTASPKQKISTPGNITPGRRRLIDSLGTRERQTEGSSPDKPPSSEWSSPIASPITTRQVEPALSPMPAGSQNETVSNDPDSTVAISPHLRGSKVTYARQRSFLDDLLLEDGSEDLGTHDMAKLFPRHIDDATRARLFAIDEPENDDGTVRSIHELRQAGGNARYRGAVESIFEDIEDPHISVSGRCSSFVQLCTKLLDPKLSRQFLECNFDKRLVNILSSNLDVPSSSLGLCAFALCSLGKPLPYILATAAWPKLLDLSSKLLDVQDDLSTITKSPRHRISKATQLSFQNIVPQLRSALLLDADMAKLSPCFLLLQCLKLTISAFQEKGENPQTLSLPLLRRVVNLILSSSSNADTSSSVEPNNPQILILGLSILESLIASGNPMQSEHQEILSPLSSLHGLLAVHGYPPSNAMSRQIQVLYIRVILNLTNSYPIICDSFATPKMIDELAEIAMANFTDLSQNSFAEESDSSALDTVILTLGALINLTEQSEASRVIFVGSENPAESLLSRLLQLFGAHVDSTFKAKSVSEVHHNVAIGYLAVLLLALCLNSSARSQVKQSLQSKGLSVVMSIVDEFLQYHRKIEQEMQPLSVQVQGEASGFHVRLQGLMNQIQQL